MSKVKGLISVMKVVGEKLGKSIDDVAAKLSEKEGLAGKVGKEIQETRALKVGDILHTSADDLLVKAGDIYAPKVDVATLERTIKKSAKAVTFIDKAVDEIVDSRYKSFQSELQLAAKDEKLSVAMSKKLKKSLDIDVFPEDFKDYKLVQDKIKDSVRKNIYAKQATDNIAELTGNGTNRERLRDIIAGSMGRTPKSIETAITNGTLDKVIAGASPSQMKNIYKNTSVAVIASRRIAGKTLEDVNKFGAVDYLTATIGDNISSLYDVFKKNNNEFGMNACKKMHHFVRSRNTLETSVGKLKGDIDAFMNLDVERKTRIRNYIETRQGKALEKPTLVTNELGEQIQLEMDADLVGKLGLTTEDVLLANKLGNTMRILRRHEHYDAVARTAKDLDDNINETLSLIDNVDHSKVLFKTDDFSNDAFGDHGINYFPISITDAHRNNVREAIEKKHPGIYDFNDWTQKQSAYQRSRRIGAVSGLDENRRDAGEEISRYFDSYLDANTRRAGQAYIDNIGNFATKYDLMNNSRKNKPEYQDYYNAYKYLINHIDERWKTMFAPQTQPSNIFTKGVKFITDINTSFALGQGVTSIAPGITGDGIGVMAEGQRMPTFNYLQTIPTTAMFKGVMPVLGAMKSTPSFALAYLQAKKMNGLGKKLTNKSTMEIAVDLVTQKIKDPEVRKAWTDYWKYENPDILMESLYSMDPRVQKLLDGVSIFFKLSDIGARNVGIAASATFAKRQWLNNADDIMSGSSKSIDRLIKDTHLFEFNSLDRDYILESARNMPEFVSRFARMSTQYELFNYSRYYRPDVIDRARKNWMTARALRFVSWNMYYTNLLRGVARSYENGDKEPLKQAGKMAVMWFGAMSLTQRVDNETLNSYASYGLGRTPLVGPAIGAVGTSYRELTGITAPSIATMAALGIYTADKLSDLISGGEGKKDSLDYAWEKTYDLMVRQPVARPFIEAYDNLFGEEE